MRLKVPMYPGIRWKPPLPQWKRVQHEGMRQIITNLAWWKSITRTMGSWCTVCFAMASHYFIPCDSSDGRNKVECGVCDEEGSGSLELSLFPPFSPTARHKARTIYATSEENNEYIYRERRSKKKKREVVILLTGLTPGKGSCNCWSSRRSRKLSPLLILHRGSVGWLAAARRRWACWCRGVVPMAMTMLLMRIR